LGHTFVESRRQVVNVGLTMLWRIGGWISKELLGGESVSWFTNLLYAHRKAAEWKIEYYEQTATRQPRL
jgi:hypothetical protein